MIVLHGTLRQRAEVRFKPEDPLKLKVWVEHVSERDNGSTDLAIEELFLPVEEGPKLPPDGSPIAVAVRPYPSGKGVRFFATKLVHLNTESGKGKAA